MLETCNEPRSQLIGRIWLSGDGKNDGGVTLEILGPEVSAVDTPPPRFPPPKRKVDVAAKTPNTARIDIVSY